MSSAPLDPCDPFWSPTAPETPGRMVLPLTWRYREDAYWIIDKDLIHPIHTMPLPEAHRLLAALREQAETDLLAAYRDLPLLVAVQRHLDEALAAEAGPIPSF